MTSEALCMVTHPASDVASAGPGCRVKSSGDKIVNQRPRPSPPQPRQSPLSFARHSLIVKSS